MRRKFLRNPFAVLLAPALLLTATFVLADHGMMNAEKTVPTKIDFNRDVRPILSENCFACHGPDANKRFSGLRLDTPEGAMLKLASGHFAIKPNDAKGSQALDRITLKADNPLHMPPPNSNKTLTPVQVEILKKWVAQGAKYAVHWAYATPVRPSIPSVKKSAWVRNPIDNFILARLEAEGVKPSPEADKRTLIRRVSFDLTGLPPTPAEIADFLNDTRPDAYERVVDRLFASPHYGERMALPWLDLSRYADTHGYHIDSERQMWRWRDWVIEAFNQNLPYDRFTKMQIAGDLLPNATREDKIATGFNRNHPINFEGGAIPEEYQTAYVMDRVDTTATTFMGLTLRCATCHDHKYDPFTQKDFYRFYAYFNNISEQGLDGQNGNAMPFLAAPLPEQEKELVQIKQKTEAAKARVEARRSAAEPAFVEWSKTAEVTLANAPFAKSGLVAHFGFDNEKPDADTEFKGKVEGKPTYVAGKFGKALKLDGASYVTYPEAEKATRFDTKTPFSYSAWLSLNSDDVVTLLSRMDDKKDFRGWDCFISGRQIFVHLVNKWETNAIRINTQMALDKDRLYHLTVTYDGSGKAKGIHIYIDGQTQALTVTHDTLTGTILADAPFTIGRRTPNNPFKGVIDEVRLYNRELNTEEAAQLTEYDGVRGALAVAPALAPTKAVSASPLRDFYLRYYDQEARSLNQEALAATAKQTEIEKQIPTVMVMQEREQKRESFILLRGQYDKFGEKVTPGTPAVLMPLPQNASDNRLSLAEWLVNPKHPLTSRVAVNRFWGWIFGVGLVKTSEDFGVQGERPSHPELLDWLSTEFIRTKWDVKGMMRLLVTSSTYRQSSKVTPELREHDPENRLLARGSRSRLPGEFVRDNALVVSGLYVPTIGGRSVKPYQTPGIWEELSIDPTSASFSAQSYKQDHGDALYRRSMYNFWKRTVPPPSLQTFDAPEREFCLVRRSVTNTPLQALILMNDPTYVEASRKFAERVMKNGGVSPSSRVRFAFEWATGRLPRETETKALLKAYNTQWTRFNKNPKAASGVLSIGESPRDMTLNSAELASWATVCSILLNLDETITKG